MKMIFQALAGLPDLEITPSECDIDVMPPAIMKPVQRWSGKQVWSCCYFDGTGQCVRALKTLTLDHSFVILRLCLARFVVLN